MKHTLLILYLNIGLCTISCSQKINKSIKEESHSTIDKTKKALKDASNYLQEKSKEASNALKKNK